MIDDAVVEEITAALDAYPALNERMAAEITRERAYEVLSALEAVPCPSQTARWTRTPVVERLLREAGVLNARRVEWYPDYQGTGNAVLLLGQRQRKRVWVLSHLDNISFLLDPGEGNRYPLIPFCYLMQQEPSRPALALGYDLRQQAFMVRAHGAIEMSGGKAIFVAADGEPLTPGTRVVYANDLHWDRETNAVYGHLDDTLAVTASLLAASVLRHYPVEVLIGLTDEEEGPPGDANQSFGRGGRRLVRHFAAPDLAIISDVHESQAMMHGPGPRDLHPGDGAAMSPVVRTSTPPRSRQTSP